MTEDEQGTRAWRVVLEHVESSLVDGTLRPGDRLPGERHLATALGVGRSSVREALRVLEVLGLVRTAVGSGPTSGAVIVARPSGGMGALMRLQVAAQGFPVRDVVETRLVLEASVVELLAARADPERLADAERLLDAMDDAALPAAEFLALDAEFHRSLADATGNDVLSVMMSGLRGSIEGYASAGAARLPDWPATAARLRGEHRGIVEAVRRADAAAARARIVAHIGGYYDEISIHDASETETNAVRGGDEE